MILLSVVSWNCFSLVYWIDALGRCFSLFTPGNAEEERISRVLEKILGTTKVDVLHSFISEKFVDSRTENALGTCCSP